jgi:hypothetical protein
MFNISNTTKYLSPLQTNCSFKSRLNYKLIQLLRYGANTIVLLFSRRLSIHSLSMNLAAHIMMQQIGESDNITARTALV